MWPAIQLTMKPPYEPPQAATRDPSRKLYVFKRMIEPLHQVFVDAAGPVLADLVGELLAVAGRAPRVDRHHGIARRGEHLVVPAIVPLVVPGSLRPAVDQEDDRVFLGRDRIRAGASSQPWTSSPSAPENEKPSSLGRSSSAVKRSVVVRELGEARAVGCRDEDLRRGRRVVTCERHLPGSGVDIEAGLDAAGDQPCGTDRSPRAATMPVDADRSISTIGSVP